MILLDFSSTLIANLHAQFGMHKITEIDPDLFRHMALNTVRSIRVKFRKEGELVIACDGRSWRRDAFPYYKASRGKARDKSTIDWKKVFEVFTEVQDDLAEHFPYRVVRAEKGEADDVIGTLVQKFASDSPLATPGNDIVIVSPDKDFGQLHKYSNVRQFDPIKKRDIAVDNPELFLQEHIIRGDTSDGIPNVLSDDDTFVVPGKRQKPITKKKLEELLEAFRNPQLSTADDETDRRYWRNLELIDLARTPSSVRQSVVESYDSQAGKDRSKIFDYLMKRKLRNLIECMQEF